MKTEKQKMLDGERYNPWDEGLTNDRETAKQGCFKLNQTAPTDREQRLLIVNQMLGYQSDAFVESPFYCDYGYNIKLGKRFYANHGCTILDTAKITIGDDVLLGPSVVISAATHPIDPVERASGQENAYEVIIGNRVWLGANVTVCPGVTIGDDVVVGAGSVVTKDLPANTVCVGSPARPVKSCTESV